ncbi:ubiquitin carboxyl-terminal hydrolase cyld-like [Limosa lapponica baueri]|uniref:ubiquitinyl hydrolase 1 n=1 Tax=Limosa lapponica baueri TaxID=1758121 RepID=A0A2I0TQS3_LIMLA|nr:ubiquitin carboxyl-terminal hydrolase cyld-like [Limosa lapponica baueri]
MGLGHPNQMKRERNESGEECEGGNSSLEVNSMVQITLDKGNQVSGIIRWLGYLPQIKHKMAGVELDEDKGVTAGEWLGKYYFHCAPKRGLFVKLQSCQPDVRFQCSRSSDLSLLDYRDLFSCTSVLDSMLFKPFPLCDRNVQSILRDEIVNPLRKSEKRNEQQDGYCHQIIMDKREDLVVPEVQQLVEHSFLASELKLMEIPSCFIIQMPRSGKEYKMFSKIIPSLELDITDLLLDSPRECCVCGAVATLECAECFKDKVFAATGLKQFCSSCSRQLPNVLAEHLGLNTKLTMRHKYILMVEKVNKVLGEVLPKRSRKGISTGKFIPGLLGPVWGFPVGERQSESNKWP